MRAEIIQHRPNREHIACAGVIRGFTRLDFGGSEGVIDLVVELSAAAKHLLYQGSTDIFVGDIVISNAIAA